MKNFIQNYNKIIQQALREDQSRQDITSKLLIPKNRVSEGEIFFKEDGTLCGIEIAKCVFQTLDKNVQFRKLFKDGESIKKHTVVATLKGKTRMLLSAERTALNFLGYLSGISTRTNQYAREIRSYKAKVFDTRKTTPGLRLLEKYAVYCGGGMNHRVDLKEMVLIKDNHREACYPKISIGEMINTIRRKTNVPIEIEVDTLDQFKEALVAYPDFILLDNMTCAQMKKAVLLSRTLSKKKQPLLEASGGITLKTIRSVAKTGVDRISIGALTHSHQSIDVSLESN
ncbi:Quinolinate phosphoribosyltransferase [decarboxylating] [hydrothermal vent metagenome]|uniref:Probable nicotinate-nucleotide pyrophosphorylase [carboxylating] n=1 Tax=hydrothermal vent metagenome TaxID=652676 RepID=A0A3B1E597_9ZZZZ